MQPQRGHCTLELCVLKHRVWIQVKSVHWSDLLLNFSRKPKASSQGYLSAQLPLQLNGTCHADAQTHYHRKNPLQSTVYEYGLPLLFVYDFVLVLPHPASGCSELENWACKPAQTKGFGSEAVIGHGSATWESFILPSTIHQISHLPFTPSHNIPNFVQVPSPLLD